MKYMLDTNICIYMIKHNLKVLSSFESKRKNGAAISAITLAELEYGISNSNEKERNRNKLISFLPLVDVLPFDGAAAVAYGAIHASLRRKGLLISIMDMLIAAHAKSQGLIAVTNNVREFERVEGLETENWA